MPHRLAGRRLGRASDHRLHKPDNPAVSVLRYEKVRTTEAKAKEVRGRVDHMITLAKRGDLSARRLLVSAMPDEPLIIDTPTGELAAEKPARAPGYTRIVKIGPRLGDAAAIVQIELV